MPKEKEFTSDLTWNLIREAETKGFNFIFKKVYNHALHDVHKALEKRLEGIEEIIQRHELYIPGQDDTSVFVTVPIKKLAHTIRQYILGEEEWRGGIMKCSNCNGTGRIMIGCFGGYNSDTETCPYCNGMGWIDEDDPKEWERGYFGYASGMMAKRKKI
jgi:hypothetical protein